MCKLQAYKSHMVKHLEELQRGESHTLERLQETLKLVTEARNIAEVSETRAKMAERRLAEREKALEEAKEALVESAKRLATTQRHAADLAQERADMEVQIQVPAAAPSACTHTFMLLKDTRRLLWISRSSLLGILYSLVDQRFCGSSCKYIFVPN